VNTVQFKVGEVPWPLEAQAQSENVVALSPQLADGKDASSVLRAMAHELTHIVQIRRLGWAEAAARAAREEQAHGQRGMRQIPVELDGIFPGYLDPVDPRFTLEAIAGRMGQIAQGLGATNQKTKTCSGGCAGCSGAGRACGCSAT
jgi:hypothetical protein